MNDILSILFELRAAIERIEQRLTPKPSTPTIRQRVTDYLRSRNNEEVGLPQIAKALGKPLTSIRAVLGHPSFVGVKISGDPMRWKLRDFSPSPDISGV